MKLTDKRFWKFEALSLLSTVLTIGIMEVCLGRFELDSDIVPMCVFILINYLIGQAIAWKNYKSGGWLKLGLGIYLYSIIALVMILLVINGLDCLFAEGSKTDISADIHVGFSPAGLSVVVLLIWMFISFIPSMITGFIGLWHVYKKNDISQKLP